MPAKSGQALCRGAETFQKPQRLFPFDQLQIAGGDGRRRALDDDAPAAVSEDAQESESAAAVPVPDNDAPAVVSEDAPDVPSYQK